MRATDRELYFDGELYALAKRLRVALEQVAPEGDHGVIQERLNLLDKTSRSASSHAERALARAVGAG